MKHAPHSLLALLTVLGLSEYAHGTGRKSPPAAVVVQRDEEKERDEQIATDAILAHEYANREYAKYQQKQRQIAQASAASPPDLARRAEELARRAEEEMAAAVEASLESERRRRDHERQMAQASAASAASPPDLARREEEEMQAARRADEEFQAAVEASLKSERRRRDHERQMALASAASVASPADPRSRKAPRSGYEAAAADPTDFESDDEAMAAAVEASLKSERRRRDHERQMAQASAASVAEDLPWFLPAGVSPGDSQAVRAKKKLQAVRVAAESDGPDDDSEFEPD